MNENVRMIIDGFKGLIMALKVLFSDSKETTTIVVQPTPQPTPVPIPQPFPVPYIPINPTPMPIRSVNPIEAVIPYVRAKNPPLPAEAYAVLEDKVIIGMINNLNGNAPGPKTQTEWYLKEILPIAYQKCLNGPPLIQRQIAIELWEKFGNKNEQRPF